MTSNENSKPKRKSLKRWQIILLIIFVLFLIGSFSGGKPNSIDGPSPTTISEPKDDLGAKVACRKWRENLSNASVQTYGQQVAGAQDVNEAASISNIPEIVSYGKLMTEAMINQDAEAYFEYGTAFGTACQQAGL
jgi:hypothetical protein